MQKLGREPSIAEMAKIMDLPEDKISKGAVSTDMPIGEDDDVELQYFIEDKNVVSPYEST